MKVTEGDYKHYLLGSIPCGRGTTAQCYKCRDGRVFKHFRNNANTKDLFNNRVGREEILYRLDELNNSTYIGPDELLVNNGEVIGYFYPYVDAKTLRKTNRNTTLIELFKNYKQLLLDTKEVSDKGFALHDVHDRNILFNGNYYIIDLDRGHFTDSDKYFPTNMSEIVDTIFGYIFKTKEYQLLKFNYYLDKEYHQTRWTDIDAVYNFIDQLIKETGLKNPTIKDLKRRVRHKNIINSYYRFF